MFWSAGHDPSRTSPSGGAEYHTVTQTLETRHSRYRAFGERFTLTGADPSRTDPSFQGRTYDAGMALYDYRNRTFDPCTGRFIQRDPVVGGDTLYNPYVFPGNNPVGNVDPMGDEVTIRGRDNAQAVIDRLREDMGWNVMALAWNAHAHPDYTAGGGDSYLLIPLGEPRRAASDPGLGRLAMAVGSSVRHVRMKWTRIPEVSPDPIYVGYDKPDYEFAITGLGLFTGIREDLRTLPIYEWERLHSYKRMYATVGIDMDYRSTRQKFGQWYCTEFYPRVGGAAKAIAGGFEALAGLAFAVGSAETGVGVGAGFAVAVHGEDVMISGFRSAWAGESLPGVTEKLLREGGLSAEDAAALDTLFSVAGTMGVSAASSLGRGGESGFRLTPSTGGAAALAVTPQGMAGARALLGAMESGAILFARKGSAPGEGVRPKLRGSGGGLPTRGRVRYVPPKWWRPSQQLPRGPQRGYLDRFGNEWVWNARQGHWDVQLSKHGVQQYAGFLGAGKRHMNVTAAGVLTH